MKLEIVYNENSNTWSYRDEYTAVEIKDDTKLDDMIAALLTFRRISKNKLKVKVPKPDLTEQEVLAILKENFHYSPDTGFFTRLVSSTRGKAGDIAGKDTVDGYVAIRIGKRGYTAGRLAVLYMTGKWPKGVVDHKDLDKTNNKWENLRDVSQTTNLRNLPLRKVNKSGYSGVFWEERTQKYHVTFRLNGKPISLGRFADKEEAVAVRLEAENKYWEPLDRIWDKLEDPEIEDQQT